jgi:F-type H+-transporting ATPase subunit gamma
MSGQLKEVRDRMKSVKSTQQITKAMKMVSAAKLRRAQDAILQLRPYANKLESIQKHILNNLPGGTKTIYDTPRPVLRGLVVVITSNRGLCGAFNSNVIKQAVGIIDSRFSHVRQAGNLSIICIGKRGYDYFRKRYKDCNLIADHVDLLKDLDFENTSKVAKSFMDGFINEEYDEIHIAYGQFKNAGTQLPLEVQYLPIIKLEKDKTKKRRADYIFEPDQASLLADLLPNILSNQFQKYLLDTHASEHGARMTAMDKASENAEEMLHELKINYNKARQEAITKELSEIVGGAAALGGA